MTLMTPEPTGGIYNDEGPEAFIRQYGYAANSGQPDRLNFGGVHAIGKGFHNKTGLALRLCGFKQDKDSIDYMNGAIYLIDRNENIAASWEFKKVIEHWNRKHAKAVYVPSMRNGLQPEYKYGAVVQLCEGTDFLLLLRQLSSGVVYYDPGIKMENASSIQPEIKKRSQFRVKHTNLRTLYDEYNNVELNTQHN